MGAVLLLWGDVQISKSVCIMWPYIQYMWALLKAATSGDPLTVVGALAPLHAQDSWCLTFYCTAVLWIGWFRIRVRQEVAGMVLLEEGDRAAWVVVGVGQQQATHKRTLPIFCNTN